MAKTDSNTREIWKPIPAWEGLYEISNEGRIRIDATRQHRCQRDNGRILKLTPNAHGYNRIQLYYRKRQAYFSVHALVTLAFIGPRPEGLTINHKNGIKTDNHIGNLEYITMSENRRHAIRLGLVKIMGDDHWSRRMPERQPRGERVGGSKLTDERVAEIKELLRAGLLPSVIAPMFSVSVSTIRYIRSGYVWKHIS